MNTKQVIGATIGAREARAQRAAQRWAEANAPDASPELVQLLEQKCAASATALLRDLSIADVETVCTAAVVAFRAAEEQRLALEAIAGAREQERLDYLRRTAERLRLTRSDPPGRMVGADRGRR